MDLIHYFLEFLGNPLLVLRRLLEIMEYIFTYFFIFSNFCRNGRCCNAFITRRFSSFAVGLIVSTTGQIDIYTVIPLFIFGSTFGDNVNYFVGKKNLEILFNLKKNSILKKNLIEETERYFAENGGKTVILARFIPIVRTIAPL